MEIQEYYEGIEPKGFIAHMPDHVYHATEGFISSSGLKLVSRSPAHYFYAPAKEPSRNMVFGSATHAALLEPEKFKNEYMILSVNDRRAAAWKQAIANRDENFTLTKPEGDHIQAIQQSLVMNSRAKEFIDSAIGKELSLFTTDPVTGVKVRVRFDLLGNGTLGDIKTTKDARPEKFMWSISDYMYHQQMALYMDAYKWETGEELDKAVIIAIENEAPFTTEFLVMDDIALAIGRHEYRKNLNKYAECLESGIWSHYDGMGEERYISLPERDILQYEADTEQDEVIV